MHLSIRSIGPVFLLTLSTAALAQWTLPNSGCSIRYAYDAAGNRSARYWYCWSGMAVQNTGELTGNMLLEPVDQKVDERVLELIELDLFPNPSSDGITITLSEAVDHASYDVYDAKGRSILHGNMQGSRLDIPTNDLAAGLYNICLAHGQEMIVRSFVVEH